MESWHRRPSERRAQRQTHEEEERHSDIFTAAAASAVNVHTGPAALESAGARSLRLLLWFSVLTRSGVGVEIKP